MSKAMIQKANEVAELMQLSEAVGAAAQIGKKGEVYLVSPEDTAPRLIGGTITEGIAALKSATTSSTLLHGAAS